MYSLAHNNDGSISIERLTQIIVALQRGRVLANPDLAQVGSVLEKVGEHSHGEVTIMDVELGKLVSKRYWMRAGMRSVS